MQSKSVKEVKTTCPYCGVGCGVIASIDEAGRVSIRGDAGHPANHGRLCSKGSALGETISLEGRLLYPEVRGAVCSWEQALAEVAGEFSRVIRRYGPDAVAFYVSGQLLTEDYYVANKLMKGFIGSANIDTNSRLCMSSAVVAHKRAFGSDTVPCSYEDLERAKLILLIGSNTAWCHPVLYQRMVEAKRLNPDLQVIQIDPRRTATTDLADRHLPIKPGTDAVLFAGLLNYLAQAGEHDEAFTRRCVEGVEVALSAAAAAAPDIETVARRCELPVDDVAGFYRLFARTERVVSLFSQGINQSSSGTDKVNSIINCHLLTGRIGRPGMGPFSMTGQPNAMGGREVGGLANQLAAHMELENPRHRDLVRRFWGGGAIPKAPGLKAVELFRAVDEGKIKALWIMGTNPAVSLPERDRVRRALRRCELVVVSDCMRQTDTMDLAQIRLPAMTWGERAGTVTNSERCISRQRAFLGAPGIARPDWWIITEVARRMGFSDAFPYQRPAEIFREHAALSGFWNAGDRAFDISALAGIDDAEYDRLPPVQWPVNAASPTGTRRMFGDGRFYTGSGRARMLPIRPAMPAHAPDQQWPLILNTGRVRDQWHTMTRTGKSPRLARHTIEPYAEIHPEDAARFAIEEGCLVRVTSRLGSVVVRARLADGQRPGSLFVPMHWNDQFTAQGGVNALVAGNTDPHSGQPESKHMPAAIEPYRPAWHGFLFSRRFMQPRNASYWSRSRGKGYWRYEMAGEQLPDDWAAAARGWLCSASRGVDWIEYLDQAAQRYRAARFVEGRLESCIFLGPDTALPPREWVESLFAKERLTPQERASLLSGQPPAGGEDTGRVICACHGVGERTLRDAILNQGLDSVEALGDALDAGTNCGSCIPELKALIASVQ